MDETGHLSTALNRLVTDFKAPVASSEGLLEATAKEEDEAYTA